jgi:putative ABC transport system permease protein
MTRHLITLMWNRKRHNLLLTFEIFFSFLVLFAVVLLGTSYVDNWRRPLGYRIDQVWRVEAHRNEAPNDAAAKSRSRVIMRQLFASLAAFNGVERVAGVSIAPYDGSSIGYGFDLQDGRHVPFGVSSATDELADLLQLQIVAGRWFTSEDDAATWRPVVITQRLASSIFGDAPAVGQQIPIRQQADHDGELPQPHRVVGVIEEFRKDGELSRPEPFLFHRIRLDAPDLGEGPLNPSFPNSFLIRVAEGTGAAFEEPLIKHLQAMAPGWSFEARPLEYAREDRMRMYTIPLVVLGTIASFLLLMVALGLTGVVWQGVTQRMREFGLRRAKGATASDVRRQVMMELAVITSMALLVGVLLVSQLGLLLPALDPDLKVVTTGVFVTSIALSVAAMYGLTLACAWHPSRLATRIQPAEALHYE